MLVYAMCQVSVVTDGDLPFNVLIQHPAEP